MNLWRNPIDSQPHSASLALISAQSSADQRTGYFGNNNDFREEQIYKVWKQTLCRCLPTLRAVANNQVLFVIINTGATINLMNTNIAKAMHTRAAAAPISVSDISGNTQKLDEIVVVPLELNGFPYVFDFYVTPTLPGDALLGMDAITEAGWVIDPIDRILLHKTHALPPIRLHPCIHNTHRLHTKQHCTLAPMSWQKIPVQDKSTIQAKKGISIIIPSPPPTLAIYGAPVVHNTEDPEKFVLLCNMSFESIDIPADAIIAYQETVRDLTEQNQPQITSRNSVLSAPTVSTGSDYNQQHRQVDKLKSSYDQVVEKHFDLTSAKQLWDPKFVKSLKRLLLTLAITWANPDIIGRTTKGEHHINTQGAQPIALPLRRIAWIEKDKIKQEIDKMKQ